jgi:ABC-2 type transport system ATP-binding protein
MIAFDRVAKQRNQRQVLHDVSFTATAGRVTALLGPNGAGKSSAIRILLGLDNADSGTALIDGQRYRTLRDPLRVVGALLDGAGAHPARTARNHLAWMAASNQIDRSRVDVVFDLVGLSADGHRRVGTFSLGMRQRLGLAGALLGDPCVLVLDEPMNGLDPDGIRWIRQLIRHRADDGASILVSSHLLGETADIADDVIILAKGRVVGCGTVAEVTAPHRSLEDAFFALTANEQ